jgi:TolB protein
MIAALAGCTASAATSVSGAAATADAATSTAPLMAGPGQDKPRSAVPWGKVGHGWALATDQATSTNFAKMSAGKIILYLIDPLGGRYTLLSSSANAKNPLVGGELTDWSGDGRRALFVAISNTSTGWGPTYQLDLRTGKFSKVPVAKTVTVIGYARPRGGQLLAGTWNSGGTSDNGSLELLNLNGKVVRGLYHGWYGGSPISSPDGTIVAMPSDYGVHLVSSTGAKLRVLAPHFLCAPVRWWDNATILATCATEEPSDSQNMWLLPVSGAKPVALTPPRPSSGPDESDSNLFRLTSGSYANARGASCGSGVVAKIEPGGKVKVLKVPGADDTSIVTATATKLLLQVSSGGCASPFPSTLAWFDPATGKETVAIPVPKNQVGVMGVVPYFDQGQQ